ncbi:hypothetical protein RDWZM_008581 [Blomia tropicalis]|uniref:Uncharacterized protein n=1 Tax=Blomia tropicalis TaxID=40697 RepID=A0A9Q0M1N5_BLOTA|nr:hypothetical protein RDWZM_008581 [Blomia tropicalis]
MELPFNKKAWPSSNINSSKQINENRTSPEESNGEQTKEYNKNVLSTYLETNSVNGQTKNETKNEISLSSSKHGPEKLFNADKPETTNHLEQWKVDDIKSMQHIPGNQMNDINLPNEHLSLSHTQKHVSLDEGQLSVQINNQRSMFVPVTHETKLSTANGKKSLSTPKITEKHFTLSHSNQHKIEPYEPISHLKSNTINIDHTNSKQLDNTFHINENQFDRTNKCNHKQITKVAPNPSKVNDHFVSWQTSESNFGRQAVVSNPTVKSDVHKFPRIHDFRSIYDEDDDDDYSFPSLPDYPYWTTKNLFSKIFPYSNNNGNMWQEASQEHFIPTWINPVQFNRPNMPLLHQEPYEIGMYGMDHSLPSYEPNSPFPARKPLFNLYASPHSMPCCWPFCHCRHGKRQD